MKEVNMKKQSKNYIVFINDHSGSMQHIASAAMKDYNINIEAIKNAATQEKLDTIVSVIGIGLPSGSQVQRQVVVSNPHVLAEKTDWPTPGGTPLYDAIANGIELIDMLPDAAEPHVSILFMITTDGDECSSMKYMGERGRAALAAIMQAKHNTGRWDFVFRVPKGAKHTPVSLGVPAGNIQEWDTTAAGMAASTAVNTNAMNSYFSARAAGATSSGSFYSNTANVNLAALKEVPAKDISTYVVPDEFHGKWIRDFILTKRMKFLKGASFFQLTKTEPKVAHDKVILIRDRATGKFFGGSDARSMINMPTDRNARLHPGDHGAYDIFIQSKSINRHLVGGTGVAYWEKMGSEFTQAEIDLYTKPAAVAVKPAVVQLPQVPVSNKPTKSPIKPTPRPQAQFFETREDARRYTRDTGKGVIDHGKGSPKGQRYQAKL